MATQDDYIKTALRLPRELHAKVQASAESTGKSMNAELIGRLEQSFSPRDDAFTPAALVALAGLQYQLAILNLKIHQLEIERQKLIDPIQEAVTLLEEHDLSEKIYDFHSLEELANESVYADKYLRERTKELQDKVAEAEKALREKAQAIINESPAT